MTALRAGGATHEGQLRSDNQDNLLLIDSVYAVADGMGGHQGGEVASEMAVDVLSRAFTEPLLDNLLEAVEEANSEIYARAQEDESLTGMGTTLVALALVEAEDEERLAIVNVGDSRAYRIQDGELVQITDDHSLVADLMRAGRLTAEEAENHPRKNIVTRALGIDSRVLIDTFEILPFAGDRYLLCSDGLPNEVSAERIASVLRRLDDPADAAAELVRLANEGGGRDNITVLVVDVVDDDGRAAAASAAVAAAGTDSSDPAGFTTAVEDDVDGGGALAAARIDDEEDDEVRGSRFTWRVAVYLLALLAILGFAAVAIGTYAQGTYFVGFEGDRVAVYSGRPSGFLWFDPKIEAEVNVTRDDLRPVSVNAVLAEPTFGKEADAARFVENLQVRPGSPDPAIGPVGSFDATTTTTTEPAPTTTTTKPGTTTTTRRATTTTTR